MLLRKEAANWILLNKFPDIDRKTVASFSRNIGTKCPALHGAIALLIWWELKIYDAVITPNEVSADYNATCLYNLKVGLFRISKPELCSVIWSGPVSGSFSNIGNNRGDSCSGLMVHGSSTARGRQNPPQICKYYLIFIQVYKFPSGIRKDFREDKLTLRDSFLLSTNIITNAPQTILNYFPWHMKLYRKSTFYLQSIPWHGMTKFRGISYAVSSESIVFTLANGFI